MLRYSSNVQYVTERGGKRGGRRGGTRRHEAAREVSCCGPRAVVENRPLQRINENYRTCALQCALDRALDRALLQRPAGNGAHHSGVHRCES